VLKLVLPFKIELSILVLKKLIDRLYETLIASKTPTTKRGFYFREQVEVRGDKVRRIYRRRERISKQQSVAAAIKTLDVCAGTLSCMSRRP
jgi:hypothetical protein